MQSNKPNFKRALVEYSDIVLQEGAAKHPEARHCAKVVAHDLQLAVVLLLLHVGITRQKVVVSADLNFDVWEVLLIVVI